MELVFIAEKEVMSLIFKAEYLYNNDDNHDKVYNVAIKQDDQYIYTVVAEEGARLGVLKSQTKYSGKSIHFADLEFKKLIREKKAKGYKVVSPISSKTNLSNIPQPQNTKPVKPKEVVKYDPNYTPERRLDFDDL